LAWHFFTSIFLSVSQAAPQDIAAVSTRLHCVAGGAGEKFPIRPNLSSPPQFIKYIFYRSQFIISYLIVKDHSRQELLQY